MNRPKVLITSAGGLVGTYLTKHLKAKGYTLVGTDMSGVIPKKDMLDGFYITCASAAPEYPDVIAEIVKKEQIDVVIPVSSYDMNVFTDKNVQQKLGNAKLLVMDKDMHFTLHDKSRCGEFLSSIGLCTPQILGGELSYPCIMKPDKSSGSKNVVVLRDEEDYRYWKNRTGGCTIYEYLEGDEFTVDCIFDKNGRCVGYNPRKRVKTNGGGAVVSTCIYEPRLDSVIAALENTGRIKGPVNFQYKEKCGKLCIFDFNTRLPSGGLPVSVKAGLDIPQLIIDIAMDKDVSPWHHSEETAGLTMVRYYEESFFADEDLH